MSRALLRGRRPAANLLGAACPLLAVALLAAVSPSRAGINLFDAGTSWNLPADWSLGHVPTASDALLFNGPAGTTLDNSFGVQTLSFDTGSSALNIDANALSTGSTTTRTLTLSGGTNALGTTDLIDLSAATTGTITLGGASGAGTLNVALGTNGTFNVANASANLVFGTNSVLSGAHNLTKTGAGTLTLSGANTYTGTTTVSAGTLAIKGGSVGVANSTATFTVDGTGTGASAAATSLSGGSLSTGLVIIGNTGAGSFIQSGGGFTTNDYALELGSNAGSSGTYTLSGGSLSTGFGPAYIGVYGSGTFTQSGGTFNTDSGSLTVGYGSGSSGTYTLSGTGSLRTAFATVGNLGTGIFNQNGGTFTTHKVTVGAGSGSNGTYNLNGGTLFTDGVVGADGTGTFNLNGGTLCTFEVGEPGGSGTGTFNLNGGTLQPSASDNPGAASDPTTYTFFSFFTTAHVQAGGAKIDTNGFNVTVAQNLVHDTTAGAAATDGGLTKIGAGTLTLTGANTYTGSTTVSAGTLQAEFTASLSGYNTPGEVTVNNGGTLAANVGGAGEWTAADLDTLRASAAFKGGSSLGIDTTNAGGSFTYASNVAGSLGLIKLGAGTLTLSGTSTFTGGTFLNAGTLVAAANGALGAGNVTVSSTAISLTLATGVNNAIADSARLTLAGGGTADVADAGYLQLNGNVEIVGSLMLGNTLYTSGIFTSALYPEYLSGPGEVIVNAVPEPGTFWMLAMVLGGVTAMLIGKRPRCTS